jgi:TfoX/Sxy family transcriptional regulator of competence genes
MAYNELLADRVRTLFAEVDKVTEKKMFGGIAFMVNDKMCVTVSKNRIMCRIDPAIHSVTIQRKGCESVIMKGREYIGYVRITEDAMKTKKELQYWIDLALDFNPKSLPSKKNK